MILLQIVRKNFFTRQLILKALNSTCLSSVSLHNRSFQYISKGTNPEYLDSLLQSWIQPPIEATSGQKMPSLSALSMSPSSLSFDESSNGIRGMKKFIFGNQMFTRFELHDCNLVVDGVHLMVALHLKLLSHHNSHIYGGDYTYLSAYIRRFFETLLQCNITPIVVMETKYKQNGDPVRRFSKRLQSAIAIYQGRDQTCEPNQKVFTSLYYANWKMSLLNSFVFADVVRSMNIPLYRADDIIPRVGYDLACPVLTDDKDFYLHNLPGGIVPVSDLVESDFLVNSRSGFNFIECDIFRMEALQKKFLGLRPELLGIARAFVEYSCIDYSETKNIIKRLPWYQWHLWHHISDSFAQVLLYTLFNWLASQHSFELAVSNLRYFCLDSNHPLIQIIDQQYTPTLQGCHAPSSLTVEQYFKENHESLFQQWSQMPDWVQSRIADCSMQSRTVAYLNQQTEILHPLIEDFSLNTSSYVCCFKLLRYIYGLLRTSDDDVVPVKRNVRKGYAMVERLVSPLIEVDLVRLPRFQEIETLSSTERQDLFFKILAIDQHFLDDLGQIVANADIEQSKVNELSTMLLSTVYLTHHFPNKLWIEFYYSLLVNIVLMGHVTKPQNSHYPKVLSLDQSDQDSLFAQFNQFDVLPTKSDYKPRVVHLYNSFQNCLNNVSFLAQILKLSHQFSSNTVVSGFQGTFLHNLTSDLMSRHFPLFHLERNLLGTDNPQLPLFRSLLDLVLLYSRRKLIAFDEGERTDRAVVPDFLLLTDDSTQNDYELFVRGETDLSNTNENNFVDVDKLRAYS